MNKQFNINNNTNDYINRGKVNDCTLLALRASIGKLFQRVMELGTKED